uniref:hypothetical protein n=1 Tax=Streptomyces sp. CA-141956 TaxID=3240051 RepID=UPI003F497130
MPNNKATPDYGQDCVFSQGAVSVKTARREVEVRINIIDQFAARTPDQRLLDDFGTLGWSSGSS